MAELYVFSLGLDLDSTSQSTLQGTTDERRSSPDFFIYFQPVVSVWEDE